MKSEAKNWINKIHQGDALEILQRMPDDFVDTIITSPPYWGLRDYGVDGQIGLEPTLEEYLEKLLKITAELKRVLKPSGIMFWNHGDCYGGSACGKNDYRENKSLQKDIYEKPSPQLKLTPKCLALQNWRLILRMIDEQGWILRNTIIWHKPNHMPSSVKDRFTNAYEPVFMLVKNKKYYFDLDSVRVPQKYPEDVARRIRQDKEDGIFPFNKNSPLARRSTAFNYRVSDAEKKSKQCPQFKLSETEQIALKYGYDPEGICPVCGRSWKRHASPNSGDRKAGLRREFIPCVTKEEIERYRQTHYPQDQAESFGSSRARYWREKEKPYHPAGDPTIHGQRLPPQPNQEGAFRPLGKNPRDIWTIPTQPAPPEVRGKFFAMFPEKLIEPMILAGCPKDGIVLDPFMGSGTTAVVAKRLGRNYIGIELNFECCKIAEARLKAINKPLI
jgi:site-specific DNA-methyltransferase (adenine-specific)